MGHPRRIAFAALVVAVAALVAACSSGQDRTLQGSVALVLGASRTMAGVQAAASSEDPVGLLNAASISIADVEARKADGSWVPIDASPPAIVDLLALANAGGTAALAPNLLPEGQYNALQLHITQVQLTRLNGTRVTLAPPGTGWVVLIPVDFGVVDDQATIVTLKVRLDLSFKFVNGEFEFEPEVELEGVEHT